MVNCNIVWFTKRGESDISEDERQLTAIHELLEQGQAMRDAYEKAKA